MKLKPRIEAEPPREFRFRLDADTHRELDLYRQLYTQEYGQEIDSPTLVSEILRQFLLGDRAFKTWKRRRVNGGIPRSQSFASRPGTENG